MITSHEDKRCGTCRYWDTTKRTLPDTGKCKLDGKKRFQDDMKGCLGWKVRE
ncbi:hypothetical protein [Desulfofalx alkaliphila]|uniref:hypothetical protein n=1 Tax=Desulfofalx alkaliphila TaxID=105483 RepID=UPI000A5E1CF9|nr:hypothetical protein [Desulfofalx alkaliphila]